MQILASSVRNLSGLILQAEKEGGREGGREGGVIFLYSVIRVYVSCIFKPKVEGWCCHHKAKKRIIRLFHKHQTVTRDRSGGERERKSRGPKSEARGEEENQNIIKPREGKRRKEM